MQLRRAGFDICKVAEALAALGDAELAEVPVADELREEIVRTLPIEIPANATGSLSLLVSDGARLGINEQREARAPQPRSVDQIIKALNKGRRNNSLYVKLLGSDAGAVVSGELLSALPPSVLGVLEGDRNGGNFNPLHNATVGQWELPTEHAVAGSRTLTITVSQN